MLQSLSGILNTDGTVASIPAANLVLADLYPQDRRFLFLFKQGIRKTNMGFVELLALLQIHCSSKNKPLTSPYQVISEREAAEYITENIRLGINPNQEDVIRLSASIENFFSQKIILESFYTSACVYISDDILVNLENITVESGYIHSCGKLVFSENTQTISTIQATEALDLCVENLSEKQKFLLVPYCHEDFTSKDRGESEFLKDGLDDVKIHISKSYLSETPLHQFILSYVDDNSDKGVAAPTNYKESRARFATKFPEKEMVTLWIISDTAITSSANETLGERYLICYRQLYKNDNPYHHYEENKPAWVSHTTLPHSLAGAMVNVARPWLPTQNPVICDPFCGSGTIYLEAQKFPIVSCHTSDQSPLAEEILHDNISFFKLDAEGISKVIAALEVAGSTEAKIQPRSMAKPGPKRDRLQKIVDVIDDWAPKCDGDFLNLSHPDVASGLEKIGSNLVDRVLLYVALRASVRGRITVDREAADWTDVFERELKALLVQMRNHLKSAEKDSGRDNAYALAEGSYSKVIIPPKPYEQRNDLFGSGDFNLLSVKDLPKGAYDAIICDPPYGFNTETNRWGAEDFAEMMIPAIVDSLKRSGGQIVLAAPRTSYSGRLIPLTLRSDYISKSILSYCAQSGLQCWKPATVIPEMLSYFTTPPYYWTAEKTLTRKILHFWVREGAPNERLDS